jgi:transcriptional regulator with XRE-family HTH domain
MIYKEFAKIIKKKRTELGITQLEMAKKIPTCKSSYCKIENGIQEPNFIILQKICILLKIDLTKELGIFNTEYKQYVLFD